MKFKNVFFTLMALLCINVTYSQSIENFISEPGMEEGDVSMVIDSGKNRFIAATELVVRAGFPGRGVVLTKVDLNNNIIWRKYFNANLTSDDNLRFFSIVLNYGKVYLLCSNNTPYSVNIVLLEVDPATGSLLNSTEYYNFNTEVAYGLHIMKVSPSQSDMIITGFISDNVSTVDENVRRRALVIRVKRTGDVVWAKTYGSPVFTYLDNTGNFFDYDRFTYATTASFRDEEIIYCIGSSTTNNEYFTNLPGQGVIWYTDFYREKVIAKINSTTGALIWDHNSSVNLEYNLFNIAKVVLDSNVLVTLENQIEYNYLCFYDLSGNLINTVKLNSSSNATTYNVGYNLLYDDNNYYVTAFNNNTNNLIIYSVDKTTFAITISEFANYTSNFNTQEVSDYFSNMNPFNQNCYYQSNSVLKGGILDVCSGVSGGGIVHIKINNNLPIICNNTNFQDNSTFEEHSGIQILNVDTQFPESRSIRIEEGLVETFIENCINSEQSGQRKSGKFNDLQTITIAPNPAHDVLEISNVQDYNLTILNNLGQKITNYTYNYSNNKIIVNIEKLDFGIYFLSIDNKVFKISKY
jgi:Secretion system C-terminal sorting domain